MKKIGVICLAVLMLSLTLKDWLSYAHYYLNQDFIAANWCINRDTPSVMCYGKCYLDQLIEANHEQESTPNTVQEEKTNINFLFCKVLIDSEIGNVLLREKLVFPAVPNYAFAYLDEIFRPPCV